MNPRHLLSDYLNGRISGEELRDWLAKDNSREARETLAILNVDNSCRNALLDFAPPLEAPERLAEKVGTVESWVEPADQPEEPEPSKGWISRLVPALDVAGHSQSENPPKKRKKAASRKKAKKSATQKKTQPRKKRSTRPRKKSTSSA
jgi:hypothetical protein